jgi:hypothetical protein
MDTAKLHDLLKNIGADPQQRKEVEENEIKNSFVDLYIFACSLFLSPYVFFTTKRKDM